MALTNNKFLAGVQLWILATAYHSTLVVSVFSGPIIGDNNVIPGSFLGDPDGLYLNTDRPATSNGNVLTVRYCYYGLPDLLPQTHRSLIALYRPVNKSHYERISDTISITKRSYVIRKADAFLPGFNCDSYRLTSSIPVLTGDIVGACIYDSGNTFKLDMLTTRLVTGYRMMFEGANDANCGTGVLPYIVGDRLQQDSSDRTLHVWAEISSNLPSGPTITTTMITTTAISTTTMTTTQAPSNTTTITPAEINPTNVSLIASITGGVLVGILFLIVMVFVIVIIVKATRTRRKQNHDSGTVMHHGESSINLIPGDNPEEVSLYYNTSNFPHDYERAETLFTHAESQLIECSHSAQSNSSENYYAACSSTPLRDQNSHFTLEGPNCSYDQLLEKNKVEDIYANVEIFREPARAEIELYAQITSYGIRSIDRSSIQVVGHLGSGQFGRVEEGVWTAESHHIKVALKTLNQSSTAENKVKFLQEAAIMAQFRHPNVVLLYGIINNDEPITLVVQLVERGDLRQHLWTLRPNPGEHPAPNLPKLLLSFSQHVALGMQYLSGKGFVHRDLAARNILVSKDNICKIADFGMSRDLANENYYISQGGMIPVKWTAPEAINYKKYSTSSDVWSYGCLLYEIWSLGYKPFEDIIIIEAIQFLRNGMRLPSPPGCPRAIYNIMIQCWNPIAAQRPVFRNIHLGLSDSEQDVLNIPQEDLDSHQLAGVLGSPLEAGERMYEDLKGKYEVHVNN